MRTAVTLASLWLFGTAMAGPADPVRNFEVGKYADVAGRPNPEQLVIEFVPSLASILLSAEKKKGSPLTMTEVEAVRDNAAVVVSRPEAAKAVETRRGYQDIDPQHAWQQWQVLRVQFEK